MTRGEAVLYSFAYGDCGADCDATLATSPEGARRVPAEVDLGGVPFRVVTISLDPARDAGRLAEVAARSGADGAVWQWATADREELRRVVGSGFKVPYEETADGLRYDPRYVLVDGWGGAARGVPLLHARRRCRQAGPPRGRSSGEELRNAEGVASLAYDAAHVFLCYP